MTRLSSFQVPPPRDWQEFERLCRSLWAEIWRDPNTQLNGRAGQPQHGVDVFGKQPSAERWSGVQCKGKDGRYGQHVTQAELRAEVKKAKKFTPALDEWILVTTAASDAKIQRLAREINDLHQMQGLFTVTVLGWDEILARLDRYPEVAQAHGLVNAVQRVDLTGKARREVVEPILEHLRAGETDPTERVRSMAVRLVETGKQSWKMPQIVAPLTLGICEDREGKQRPTSTDELLTLIADGTPLLLNGVGGIGKTTLLLQLADHCLASGDRVPLFVDAAAWAQRNTPLLHYLVNLPAAQGSSVSEKDLIRLAREGRLVLVLNGWNEMPAQAKIVCRDDLFHLIVTAPMIGVVIATRRDGPGLAHTKTVEVRGLTWRDQSRIIRGQLDARRADELIEVLATNTPLRHAARSPLILRGAISKAKTGVAVDATVLEFLGAAVSTFEQDEQRRHVLAAAPIETHHHRFLEALARELTQGGATRWERENAIRVITATARQLSNDGLYTTAPGAGAVLDTLVNYHLLHAEDNGVRFAHQRFQEYFAAEWLWRMAFQSDDASVLTRIINVPAWDEVVLLICERLATRAYSGHLTHRLVTAAASIDLGAACQFAGACDFTSADDPLLHASLVSQVTALGASVHSSVRALARTYQIVSGLPDFAAALWDVIEGSEGDAELPVISIKQLGGDLWKRITQWPAKRRADFLLEVGRHPENYDLLVDLAHHEPEAIVRSAAIASLFWNFPASDEPMKAWLSAPSQVQLDRDLLRHVMDAVEEGQASEEVRVRLREIALSGGAPDALFALVRMDPRRAPPTAIDALFALISSDDHRFNSADIIPILAVHDPVRLEEVSIAAVLNNKVRCTWACEVLTTAAPSLKRRVLEETRKRVRGTDFRMINAAMIGPLADREQIAQTVDQCMGWEQAPRDAQIEGDRDRQRVWQGVLAHVDGAALLEEIFSRAGPASYAEAVYLLKLILIRIRREHNSETVEMGWLPTRQELRRLINLFASKVDPADIPTVAIPVHLARIAGHVDAVGFADVIVDACRIYLDAWLVYDERLQQWDPTLPYKRPTNPAWNSYLLPVLGAWGLTALPALSALLDHPAADHFIPDAISYVSAALWSKPGSIYRPPGTYMREGRARQTNGRALRQPDDTYQAVTDQVAELLSGRLLRLVSSVQGPPSPMRHAWRLAELHVGQLAKLVAVIPSPHVLVAVHRAIVAGPMDLYAQVDCVRNLLRQGATLDEPTVIAALENSLQARLLQSWIPDSERYLLAGASEILVCAAPASLLSLPRREYLALWQKFASPREVIRALGHIQDDSLWPVLLDAVKTVGDGRDAAEEVATAITQALSPVVFPEFLALIRDGIFFRWCNHDWKVKQLCPRIAQVLGDSRRMRDEFLGACRECESHLAVVLAGYTLAEIPDHSEALSSFFMAEIETGKISSGTPISRAIIDFFKLATPVGQYQFELTTRAQNDLRRQLYRRAKDADAPAATCRDILALIEGSRWHIGRPLDEPRHPDIDDGLPWTRALTA